jgi:hypothetical protein
MSPTHVQRVHTEPVVLDIGVDTGSVIIYTGPEMLGVEIEISPRADPTQRTHTDVAERRASGKTIYAAVSLPMPEGDYLLWGPDPEQPTLCAIVAGTITQLDWRWSFGRA